MNYKTSDLIKDLAPTAGSQIAAKAIITELFTIITGKLASGTAVSINDFGKFESTLRKGRSGTVPGSNPPRTYTTQDKMIPAFKASSVLKQSVAEGK